MPFSSITQMTPRFYKGKVILLHEDEQEIAPIVLENPTEEASDNLHVGNF